LPDVEGDVKYDISTFASKFGVQKIAIASSIILGSTYCVAAVLPFLLPGAFKALPMTAGHLALLAYFIVSYSKLDTSSMKSVKQFYKAIWNLFYLEYCLYPLI
jgi:4-hydroxybenzoate polyprenyltransferase